MAPLSLLSVTVALLAVLTEVRSSSFELKRKLTKIQGFNWKNCGSPDVPAVLKSLTVSPDPIAIPGELTASASGSTSVELSAPLSLNITLEKDVAGFWVKVPCVEKVGSCHYPDACEVLTDLIPPGHDCPEPLHTYGLPCRCPFKAGSYSLPQSQFSLPHMDLPYWLTNGDYRVQGVLGAGGKELGCVKISLSIHSESAAPTGSKGPFHTQM